MEIINENLRPVTINEILDKQFIIPHYQRGYRWTSTQVKQLLDDIDSFVSREIPGKLGEKTFYCLQPIVVKLINDKKKQELKEKGFELEGDWYEVIDGQQRLTTIFIMLQYINQKWLGEDKLEQFKIIYETRKGCIEFLKNLKVNVDNTVSVNKSNIDFYHISKALETIREWQLNYEEEKGKKINTAEFQSTFIAAAKVIWYKIADDDKDGRPLFERLNLGKIPLTNAELTKALFLSSESFTELPEEERKIKKYEIARLWDEIEHKLNEKDLKFWSFITNKKRAMYETKIDLILDLIAGKDDTKTDPLYTFLSFIRKQKTVGLASVWEEIEHFYFTLLQWHSENDFYHKIGYLVTARKFGDFKEVDLAELVKDSKIKKKPEFINQVDGIIKDSVKVELSELRYEQRYYNQIFNVLLLFNVETNRKSEAITEFYPFKQHKSTKWSLEHIHARNSDNFDKSKKDPWIEWLSNHLKLITEIIPNLSEERKLQAENLISGIDEFNNDSLTWERFTKLFKAINNFFIEDAESMDKESEGLRNLALLSQPDNSALNSSVFEVKKRAIIALDMKGSFIPVCTRRAFMKYYTKDASVDQNYFWSKEDRTAYFKELSTVLKEYLPLHHIDPESDED